jgi:hypothetical protein
MMTTVGCIDNFPKRMSYSSDPESRLERQELGGKRTGGLQENQANSSRSFGVGDDSFAPNGSH